MEIRLSPQEAVAKIDDISSILEIICRTTEMGFAAVARVTDKQWIACAVRDEIQFGLQPGDELVLETTLCNEVREHHAAIVIDHVDCDEVYRTHHTPKIFGLQSYISVPIFLSDGAFFGTLCAIDRKPSKVKTPHIEKMFKLFANVISSHLGTLEQLNLAELKLTEQMKESKLREQFIAILGHDLRNPVSAIANAASFLLRKQADETTTSMLQVITRSSHRIDRLVENLLDFTKTRLGEGISLNYGTNSIRYTLEQIVNEFAVISPERRLLTDLKLTKEVRHDASRIGQLFSNLLGNALTHGAENQPVTIYAGTSTKEFTLSVTNKGNKIPDETLQHLFRPFFRGDVKLGQQGLGLGLYISSEIARAHNGHLVVTSTPESTTFTLTMPID